MSETRFVICMITYLDRDDKVDRGTVLLSTPDEEPEFYASYRLLNCRTHKPYTCEFNLKVLYLNHIYLAKEERASDELIFWAKAFMATTWEELRSLAGQSRMIKEVAANMLAVHQDVSTRSIAEAHEKYIMTYKTIQHMYERETVRANNAEARADAEAVRADAAEARADEEATRADAAEAEVARLKAMLASIEAKPTVVE